MSESTYGINTIVSICGFVILFISMILGFTKQSNESGRLRGIQEEKNKNFEIGIKEQKECLVKHEEQDREAYGEILNRVGSVERKVDVMSDNIKDIKQKIN